MRSPAAMSAGWSMLSVRHLGGLGDDRELAGQASARLELVLVLEAWHRSPLEVRADHTTSGFSATRRAARGAVPHSGAVCQMCLE